MAKYIQNEYHPQHPEKYDGTYPIISRSSWEWDFMVHLDLHPDVLRWASESVQIPYHDPITNKQKIYIPDFLLTILTKDRREVTKLVEIKPLKEATEANGTSQVALVRARNNAKWGAAQAWCMRRGIEFEVLTEVELFDGHALREGKSTAVRQWTPAQAKKRTPKKVKVSKAATKLNTLANRIKINAKGRLGKVSRAARTKRVSKI